MKKYNKESKRRQSTTKRFLKENKKKFTALLIVVAIVIVGAILLSNFATQQGFESSFLVSRDTIKIGIRTDVEGFGGVDEEGNLIGFDREYIDAALKEILGNQEKLYEYYPLSSQDAGGAIKYGTVDIALGLLNSGVDKTKGFTLTDPYYTDDVVLVMRADSRVQSIQEISAPGEGQDSAAIVGLLTTAVPSGDFIKHLKDKGMEFEVARYSDYESAMTDLDAGSVPAVAMPRALSKQFERADYRIVAEPVYEVGYGIMLPTGQSEVAAEFNRVIEQFAENGTTQALKQKWGI